MSLKSGNSAVISVIESFCKEYTHANIKVFFISQELKQEKLSLKVKTIFQN